MSGEILQEYLVRLGYQTDAVSFRRFEESLGKTGKAMVGVSAAVAGIVSATGAATAAYAQHMRKMYIASDLAGTTVAGLRGMALAGDQVGLGADGLSKYAQQLNMLFNTYEGAPIKSFLEGTLKVKTAGRETGDIFKDSIRALKELPDQRQAYAFAEEYFHIPREDYYILAQSIGKIDELEAKTKAIHAQYGSDPEKAEKLLKGYSEEISILEMKFTAIGDVVLTKLSEPMSEMLKSTSGWIDKLNEFLQGNGSKEPGFLHYLKEWWNGNKGSGANENTSLLSKGVMGLMKGGHYVAEQTGKGLSNYAAWGKKYGIIPDLNLSSFGISDAGASEMPSNILGKQGNKKANRNERNNNPGNIEYGSFAKAHGAVGTDGRFAIFPDMGSGFKAMNDLLSSYRGNGNNTVNGIIGKWAPPNENNTSKYASTVAAGLGVGGNEQLDMNDPTINTKLSKYIAQYEGMSAATVNQNITFNVTGTNAGEISDSIATKMNGVNSKTVREFKGGPR